MAKRQFLQAKWKNLLMLNYEVDPDILKPYLPPYTVVDLWQVRLSEHGWLFISRYAGEGNKMARACEFRRG